MLHSKGNESPEVPETLGSDLFITLLIDYETIIKNTS